MVIRKRRGKQLGLGATRSIVLRGGNPGRLISEQAKNQGWFRDRNPFPILTHPYAPQKVRFVLEEKGLEWSGHEVNLSAGEAQRPEYLKLNPNGVVPTLVHDGRVIIESTVINEYLDDAFPEPPLRPADPVERARMRLWTKQLDEGVHAATGILTKSIALRYRQLQKSRQEIDAYIAGIPNSKKKAEDRESILKGLDSSYFPDAVRRFARLVADMDAALQRGRWLAGDSFSLADIGFVPTS